MDPRFPGGTGSAVADELAVLPEFGPVSFVGVSSDMFRDRPINPKLAAALADSEIEVEWDPPVVTADVILVHNPSFLKFNRTLDIRLACDTCIAVTHENFVRPDGAENYDVAGCSGLLDDALLARQKVLAPVSDNNRDGVAAWLAKTETDWSLASANWPNICDFTHRDPTPSPRDRRGRHSRPGPEKFPSRDVLETLFPAEAEANVILGADHLLLDAPEEHWTLYPFGALQVPTFMSMIDFFVYFTNPFWRESFGRVIAEAIAAGKLVITDRDTARTFGDGVIGTTPDQVDAVVARYVADPDAYRAEVAKAQAGLAAFSSDGFRRSAGAVLATVRGGT